MIKYSVIIPVYNQEDLIIRALESVPVRDDIEVIVIDDNSDDNTYSNVKRWGRSSNINIKLLHNDERIRCSGCINRGLEVMIGDYYMQLDSDDFLYTENFNKLLDLNRTEDLIFFQNRINDGGLLIPSPHNKGICDHICMYKRDLIGAIRHEPLKFGSGWNFHWKIYEKPHTEYYFNEIVYHYNYPRENSNFDLGKRGLL